MGRAGGVLVVLSPPEPSTGWFWAVQVLGAILPFLQPLGHNFPWMSNGEHQEKNQLS